ncbi:MAG: hypothetical protein AB7F64_07150 [Gammaproteobacteria bacterium]
MFKSNQSQTVATKKSWSIYAAIGAFFNPVSKAEMREALNSAKSTLVEVEKHMCSSDQIDAEASRILSSYQK